VAEQPAVTGWDAHVHVFDARLPVLGGHYVPATRSLADIEAHAQPHGVNHLVLVQPSVYGTDNSLVLDTLARSGGRHRGVVVLGGNVASAELDAMHALGVRGARFNLVSPVGNRAGTFESLAPRLAELGWHAQWYVPGSELQRLVDWQRRSGLVFVLDHLGGLTPHSPNADWNALAELANAGSWLKLSGWYRLDATPPYDEMIPLIERAAKLFGDRLVWGSDWPHTSLAAIPDYRSLVLPVRGALGEDYTRRVLTEFPPRLYAPS
jgi:predicted TIM-barrel fold metal-dependent hydrolase